MQLATSAAVKRPVPSQERSLLVDIGEEEGVQREVLSEYALVFSAQPGMFEIPSLDPHRRATTREYIYKGKGQPSVETLAVVETDEGGNVVRLVEVNAKFVSRPELIKLMELAGWKLNLRD